MKTSVHAIAIASLVGALSTAAMAANTAMPDAADTTANRVAPPAAGTISAREVPDPKNTLASAKIIDLSGNSVGSVDDVMLDATGKPSSLKVDVGGFLGIGGKDVALDASALKFDPAKKVLITNMTKAQIQALPELKS
jgi:sporulation protein YlmC with PRC-barrel domain